MLSDPELDEEEVISITGGGVLVSGISSILASWIVGPLEAGHQREREAPLFCAGCNRGYMGIRNRQRDFLLNYVGAEVSRLQAA